MARLTQADLVDLNRTFEESTPLDLLRWASETFGERIAALSSMQQTGNVICHMLYSIPIRMPVVFVDTGVHFQETLQTRDRVSEAYGLQIRTLAPEKTMEEQTKELGVLYLSPDGQKECCELRKTRPIEAIRGEFDALIGSLRRSDGGRRETCPILAVDTRFNMLRINPLVNVTDEDLEQYIAENEVITHPLLAQGYSSIGCNRCTTPVLETEPKRAGRWRHLGPWSIYCGINPTDLDPDRSPALDLPQDLVDRILGRETDFMI